MICCDIVCELLLIGLIGICIPLPLVLEGKRLIYNESHQFKSTMCFTFICFGVYSIIIGTAFSLRWVELI